jgi:hypothetical protein
MMSVNIIIPKGSIAGIVLNGLVLIYLVCATALKGRYNHKFIIIYVYIIFLFILIILQSSNYLYSITNYIKYIIGLLCLPLGFNILSSLRKFREFQKTGILLLILYVINIILANVFHFGDFYGYKVEGSLEIGNVFSDGLYTNAYIITSVILLLLFFPEKKKLISVLSTICAILIIVNMKRTVILVLFVGLLSYLMLYFIKNGIKTRLATLQLKYITIFVVLALISLPIFYPYIQMNLEARQKTIEKAQVDINNEGRILELKFISDEIFESDNISTFLFGKETLNLVGTYAAGKFGNRQIHGDYSKMLHGTGVIGILIWLLIHIYIIDWIIRLNKKVTDKKTVVSSVLYSLFFSFFFMYCLSMMSGVWSCVISSSYFYASIGGILRYFYNKNILIQKAKSRYDKNANSSKL